MMEREEEKRRKDEEKSTMVSNVPSAPSFSSLLLSSSMLNGFSLFKRMHGKCVTPVSLLPGNLRPDGMKRKHRL